MAWKIISNIIKFYWAYLFEILNKGCKIKSRDFMKKVKEFVLFIMLVLKMAHTIRLIPNAKTN